MSAATSLVDVVDSYVVILPGVTEWALRDLQITVDVLHETAQDIRDELFAGYHKEADEVMDDIGDAEDDEHEDNGDGGRGEKKPGCDRDGGDERFGN